MEIKKDAMEMLDLMVRPAFCVKDRQIVYRNRAARQRMIPDQISVFDILATGWEEYTALNDGCLYLQLKLGTQFCGASVTVMDGFQVFILEDESGSSELNAMALAAQELRGPLANITAISDQLFPAVASVGEETKAQLAMINKDLYRMQRIILGMANAAGYSSPSASQPELRDIRAVMGEWFTAAEDLLSHANIHLRFQNLPGSIYTLIHTEKLERAVYNIISNAAKFAPVESIVEARLTRRGRQLYLTVEDRGKGIEPGIRGSIYDRYLRKPGVEDERFGIGLGMVLIRSAATAHGGTVLVQQPENGGFRITMTLTIRQDTNSILRSPSLWPDYAGERSHILIELSDCLPASLYDPDNIN